MLARIALVLLVLVSAAPAQDESLYPPIATVRIFQSLPDGAGRFTLTLDLPNQPVRVLGGSETRVYRALYLIPLESGTTVTRVWPFIAVGRGDIVEADLELYTPESSPGAADGFRVFQASLHKEFYATYDAWESGTPVAFTATPQQSELHLTLLGRVTGVSLGTETLTADIHYGLRLQLKQQREGWRRRRERDP